MNTGAELVAENDTTAATAELPLVQFEWRQGLCMNPEVIQVPGLPQGCREFVIQVAQAPDSVAWTWVGDFRTEKDHCEMWAPEKHRENTRVDAIKRALLAAIFFVNETGSLSKPLKKQAVKALEAFHAGLADAEKAHGQDARATRSNMGESPMPPDHGERALPRGKFMELRMEAIQANPENHRKEFDGTALDELKRSIVANGLLQPIAVRVLSAGELGELPGMADAAPVERYEIILGERRWRAHRSLGAETIEAKVYEGVSRAQGKAAALVENLQRVDINAIEEAEGLRDLMAAEGITQGECAARVGRSRPAVANALRLLALPECVVELIRAKKLTVAHGLALAKWKDRPDVLKIMAEECVTHKTSAGQLEQWNQEGSVPFMQTLSKAGLVVGISQWDFERTVAGKEGSEDNDDIKALLASGKYAKDGQYHYICWEPEHWKMLKAEKTAAQREREEKELAKREKALKNPAKIKSVEDLDWNAYTQLHRSDAAILPLLPVEKVIEVDDEAGEDDEGKPVAPEKVTVCLAPKFAERVRQAVREETERDRKEKMPAILDRARGAVKKWKKIGPEQLAILATMMLYANDGGEWQLNAVSAAQQGVKLPSAFKPEYEHQHLPENLGKFFTAFEGSAVDYMRVLADGYLLKLFTDYHWEGDAEPTEEHWRWDNLDNQSAVLLGRILGVDELGLLDESKAGRKELVERVRALPWYAEALAEAEGNNFHHKERREHRENTI